MSIRCMHLTHIAALISLHLHSHYPFTAYIVYECLYAYSNRNEGGSTGSLVGQYLTTQLSIITHDSCEPLLALMAYHVMSLLSQISRLETYQLSLCRCHSTTVSYYVDIIVCHFARTTSTYVYIFIWTKLGRNIVKNVHFTMTRIVIFVTVFHCMTTTINCQNQLVKLAQEIRAQLELPIGPNFIKFGQHLGS